MSEPDLLGSSVELRSCGPNAGMLGAWPKCMVRSTLLLLRVWPKDWLHPSLGALVEMQNLRPPVTHEIETAFL